MPLPQRIRPVSIFGSLKFRPSKQDAGPSPNLNPNPNPDANPNVGGSAGTTARHSPRRAASEPAPDQSQAHTVVISGPLNLATEGMSLGNANGGSRTIKMHAYARAPGPEPVANGSSGPRNNPDRADTPNVFASRQAAVEAARIPVPSSKTGRFGSVSHQRSTSGIPPPPNSPPQTQHSQLPPHSQPPHASPPRRPRTNSNDRAVGGGPGGGGSNHLWPAPSIIADSEFNSPHSNLEDSRHGRYQPGKDDGGPQSQGQIQSQNQSQAAWNAQQRGSAHYGDFIIGNNGMMKVRTVNKDHAAENHQNQDPFTGSPPRRTKLPLHGAQQRRSYAEHTNNNLADEDEIMGAVPSFESNNRGGLQVPKSEGPSQGHRPLTQFDNIDDYEIRTEGAVTPGPITPKAAEKKVPRKGLMESSMPPYQAPKDERNKKRRRQSCDYDDNALASMSYADLQNQSFDFDPSADPAPPGMKSLDGDALPKQLNYYKTKPEADQMAFFTSMAVADWDRCGDWFLDEFGSLVQQMKESRQRRRNVVDTFERELSSREESVRLKNESIAKKLDKMKQNGERVVTDDDEQ